MQASEFDYQRRGCFVSPLIDGISEEYKRSVAAVARSKSPLENTLNLLDCVLVTR